MGTITLTVSGLLLLLVKDKDGVANKLEDTTAITIGVFSQDNHHKVIFRRNGKDLLVKKNIKMKIVVRKDKNITPSFHFQQVDDISTGRLSFNHILPFKTFLHPDIEVSYKEANFTTTLEIPRGRLFTSKTDSNLVKFEYLDGTKRTYSNAGDELKIEIGFHKKEKVVLIIEEKELVLSQGDELIFRNHTNHESPEHFSMIYTVAQVDESKRARVVKSPIDPSGHNGTMCSPILGSGGRNTTLQ